MNFQILKLLAASVMFYGLMTAAFADGFTEDPGRQTELRESTDTSSPVRPYGGGNAPVRSRGLGAGMKAAPGLLTFE